MRPGRRRRVPGLKGTALVLAVVTLVGCQLEATTSHNVALLYGVTIYDSAYSAGTAPNLSWPSADVEALTPLLQSSSGGVFQTVVARTDAQATKAQLIEDIRTAAQTLDSNSEFLLYYSGHGDVGTFSTLGSHAVIVPYGAYAKPNNTFTITQANLVTEDELRDLLATLPTKKVVVILDSCNSGGFIASSNTDSVPQDTEAYYRALWKALLSGNAPDSWSDLLSWYSDKASGNASFVSSWTAALAAGSGFASNQAQVLTAAGALESSYDDDASGHGAFTNYLLKARASGDADGNSYVTVSEAYRYAFAQLQDRWNGVWGAVAAGKVDQPVTGALSFLPHLSSGSVDFLLFKK